MSYGAWRAISTDHKHEDKNEKSIRATGLVRKCQLLITDIAQKQAAVKTA